MKRLFIILTLLTTFSVTAGDFQEIVWDDLITEEEKANPPPPPPPEPDNWVIQDPDMSDPMSTYGPSMMDDPMPPQVFSQVRDDMDGKKIKIPGFVVPLEGDDKVITEFLLVPYFGACIHVPPPPTNQVIYVKYPKGAPISDLWDAIWVYGIIRAESKTAAANTAGYTMDASKVEIYLY